DERTNLGSQVATEIREFFKEKVFRTVIPRNVRLGEAPSHGMPVILYDVKSRGAGAYIALAREVLERSAATAAWRERRTVQIIAGERRWRAAMKAGLLRVPIAVRDVASGDERSLLEMALIENIQREDLNPIEEAIAYRRLADEFQMTQEDIAAAVGKDRTSVANYLRLLKLPDEVRAEVAAGTLSMGHARALLALSTGAEQRR